MAADLTLGTLLENSPHEHTLTLHNPGSRPVTVEAADGPCDWNRSGLALPFVVPAGDRHALKSVPTPSTVSDCGRAKCGGVYSPMLPLRHTTGGRRQTPGWQLRDTLKPTLHVAVATNGRLWVGERTAERLVVPQDVPLAAPVPDESVRERRGRLVGQRPPERRAGRFTAAGRRRPAARRSAHLQADRAGRPVAPTDTHLRVVGECVERVVAEPRAVRLGRRQVGTTGTDTFTLWAVAGKPLAVARIEAPAGVRVRRLAGSAVRHRGDDGHPRRRRPQTRPASSQQ